MRISPWVPFLAILCGCGSDTSVVEGTFLDSEGGHVWIAGQVERYTIDETGFRLPEVSGDTIDLHFSNSNGFSGRMRVLDLPPGATLTLHDVFLEDDRAFPTSITLSNASVVTINRIRMTNPASIEGPLAVTGRILAMSSDEAFLLRPGDDRLPDLRIVVVPATSVEGVDGDPVSLSRLDPGDSVTVEGAVLEGYHVAARVTVPRELGDDDDRPPSEPAEPVRIELDDPPEPERGGGNDDRPDFENRDDDDDNRPGGQRPPNNRGGGNRGRDRNG